MVCDRNRAAGVFSLNKMILDVHVFKPSPRNQELNVCVCVLIIQLEMDVQVFIHHIFIACVFIIAIVIAVISAAISPTSLRGGSSGDSSHQFCAVACGLRCW